MYCKVCLLTLIELKRQILPEINLHAHLFGTLEYLNIDLHSPFQVTDASLTACVLKLGLNLTGHMSFLTGQDWTPKFAGRVQPDRTKSGLTFLNILHTEQQNFIEIHQIETSL